MSEVEKKISHLIPDQYKLMYEIEIEARRVEVKRLTNTILMLLKKIKKTVPTSEYIELRNKTRKALRGLCE